MQLIVYFIMHYTNELPNRDIWCNEGDLRGAIVPNRDVWCNEGDLRGGDCSKQRCLV